MAKCLTEWLKMFNPQMVNQEVFIRKEEGFSLVTMALLIMVIGLFLGAGIRLHVVRTAYENEAVSKRKIEDVELRLRRFVVENGRYPCPAPLDAALDSDTFGIEASTDCTAGALPGTFRATGRDGRLVRTGAVPVRTLGLADSMGIDAYRQRIIYAVTEEYAGPDAQINADRGAIRIVDTNDNSATAMPGNIVYIVYSMGGDNNGAYSHKGILLQPCNTDLVSGENCDFDTDATFRNTIAKIRNENNPFVHMVTYSPAHHIVTCVEEKATVPQNVAFLIDTSNSMGFAAGNGFCPSSMPGCSRIDVARWALRRAVPTRITSNNTAVGNPGATSITGFVIGSTVGVVKTNMRNIVFDDPRETSYTPATEEEISVKLEDKLQTLCPSGDTPLGTHISALAQKTGDGESGRPNKVIVISDGESNRGETPIGVAARIRLVYPNIQVDVIDMFGNPALRRVAELTGGKYFSTDNPDELLQALYAATGTCETFSPKEPDDQPGCGSMGNWWNN